MNVLEFILKHWSDILILLLLGISVIGSGIAWFKKHTLAMKDMSLKERIAYVRRLLENLEPSAVSLVTDAELSYGGGTGPIKKAWVIDELYRRIPVEYRKYVTEENLGAIVEHAIAKAEGYWEQVETNISLQDSDCDSSTDYYEEDYY